MRQETVQQRTAGVQFLYLLANAIARLCLQEMQLRRRLMELSTLIDISRMLTDAHGLQQTLDRVTSSITQVLGMKACSLRLLDDQRAGFHSQHLSDARCNPVERLLQAMSVGKHARDINQRGKFHESPA